ncbi:MAG: hypothetical protein K2X71_27625 [Methylobacterium sp.]|uniref:hypothetical protein n=1 Tax=Methylobacterium sp. TaxID=409 RepID=UPI002583F318|nr:hypothetical protein [Methylobacterium sp.]MBY0299762.1 hypothetical protein [Methylobacterium sp.]
MSHRDGADASAPLLAWTWRVAIVVALACVAATRFLAGVGAGAPPPGSPLAALRGVAEPETTGALGSGGVRLDPCAAPRRP